MKNYKSLLSDQHETWQHAIDRYLNFTKADMKDFFPIPQSYFFKDNESYCYHSGSKYSQLFIDKFESERSHHIPYDLADLLTKHGCFTIGRGIFEIFTEEKGFLNLTQALDFYNLNKVVEQISDSMLDSLNQYYFFFGVSFPQSDEISFLYFDKAGHLGKMYIHIENIDMTIKKTLPAMFNGKQDQYTLTSLIGSQIDRVIINALIVKGFVDIQ